MLSMTNEQLRPSRPHQAGRGTRMLQTAILALACAVIATPGFARSPVRNAFDGDWSVLIMTQNGPCDPSLRYGVQISNGEVLNNGGSPVAVQGRVTPRGMVRVNVSAGGQWASGAGRLDLKRGGGVWQGQGSAGACSGTWVAQRRSAATAAAMGPGEQFARAARGPIYNYAPQTGPMAQAPRPRPVGQALQAQNQGAASYCAQRFRTYDPASGTFIGSDGMRHRCP